MNYVNHIIFNSLVLSLLLILHHEHTILTTLQLFLFVIGFFIGTVYLTPDLDIKSEASKRSGILFLPFKKLTTHRGISHKWFTGSIVIILYTFLISIILIWIIFGTDGITTFTTQLIKYNKEIFLLITGMVTSNLLHVFLDKVT